MSAILGFRHCNVCERMFSFIYHYVISILVAATANCVVRCEATQLAVAVTNRSALSSDKMRSDEISDGMNAEISYWLRRDMGSERLPVITISPHRQHE